MRADAFHLQGTLLRSLQATDLRGALQADWQTNHFNVQLTAKAIEQGSNLPPVDIEIRASGDTNAAQMDVAKISTPALQAELPAPVAISFRPPFLSQARGPESRRRFGSTTLVCRHAANSPGTPSFIPAKNFRAFRSRFPGTGMTTTSLSTSNLQMNGELNWPVLDVQRAQIVMDDSSARRPRRQI